MTRRNGSPLAAALLASAVAGPLFVALFGAAAAYLQLPRPITIDPAAIAIVLIVMPALFVGFALAFVPTLIGSMALGALADRGEVFRLPEIWMIAGAFWGSASSSWPGCATASRQSCSPWSPPPRFARGCAGASSTGPLKGRDRPPRPLA